MSKPLLTQEQIAMRDACFSDMLRVIKQSHDDTPLDVDGRTALAILYDSVSTNGPNGFGLDGGVAMTSMPWYQRLWWFFGRYSDYRPRWKRILDACGLMLKSDQNHYWYNECQKLTDYVYSAESPLKASLGMEESTVDFVIRSLREMKPEHSHMPFCTECDEPLRKGQHYTVVSFVHGHHMHAPEEVSAAPAEVELAAVPAINEEGEHA